MRRTPLRLSLAATLALGITLAASTVCSVAASAQPTPRLAHPAVAARPLVNRYLTLLKTDDEPGLKRFLAPSFQIQRADGTGADKAAYLANLPSVSSFTISNLIATAGHGALIVRYLADVDGTVNGKPYTPGPAPRLSVFTWNGTRWQLAAHANFNPLTG